MKTAYAILIALALPLAAASTSWAQCDTGCDAACGCDNGCGCDPGCNQGCCKVCKLVKVEKEFTTECYGVKCKDICLPKCGSGCYKIDCLCCGGNGCCCDGCTQRGLCKIKYPVGCPGKCAKVKTVKQLVKYERTKKICTYEWRVVCAGPCDPGCGCDADPGCGCDAGNGCDAGCDANGCDAGCDAGHSNGDSVPMPPTPAAGA